MVPVAYTLTLAQAVERLEAHAGEVVLPGTVWHEFVYGAEQMDERRRSYLADSLTEVVRPSMPIIPYDAAAAQWHREVCATLEAQGRPRPFAVGQIAAIAATWDLILVTRNTSDFESGYSKAKTAVCDCSRAIQKAECP